MRICLISPPFNMDTFFDLEHHPFKQPIQTPGIAYIAGTLEANGFDIDIIDCPPQNISVEQVIGRFKENMYDAVGVSIFIYNLMNATRICNEIKRINPSAFLFIGGFFPTTNIEYSFKLIHKLDCCVIGEGEYTTLALLKALRDKTSYQELPGIAYESVDRVIINEPTFFNSNLDSLAFPKISFISKNNTAGIVSSRGCYGSCSFCAASQVYWKLYQGERVRKRSPENLVEEIEMLVKKYHVKNLIFLDDCFLVGSSNEIAYAETLHTLIKQKGINIRFVISTRADVIERSREVLIKLKDIGLSQVYIGCESFVQRQLDYYNKKVTVAQNLNAIRILSELDIAYDMGLIYFEPYTTIDEIIENMKILYKLSEDKKCFAINVPVSTYQPLLPLQGSKIYDELKKEKLMSTTNGFFDSFIDKKVGVLYKYIVNWIGAIKPIIKQFDLIYKAELFMRHEVYEKLIEKRNEFFRFDIQFVEGLCLMIKNEYNIKKVNEYISISKEKAEQFKNSFEEIGREL